MLPRLLSLLAPLASLASLTSLVSIASLAPLASAQTNLTEPSFLPNSGVVLSPPQNATLKADGGLVHIQYNGIAAEGFESTRLEIYLLTTSNGLSPPGFNSSLISGYQRLGTLAPLAQLPPNAYQNATTDSLRNQRLLNAYDYEIPLPVNTVAGEIAANLTMLEFYHSPDDQGMVWVSLVYHPVVIDATP